MSFKFNHIFLIVVFIISSAITGCYKAIDPSETPKIVSQEQSLFTGLPDEILNNPDFSTFISDKNGSIDNKLLPFSKGNSFPLNLNPMREEGKEISGLDNYGNPVFFSVDTEYGIKVVAYSIDKRYASEVVSSEPDTLAYLWDIKEKKLYQICACGTVCKLMGIAWLDNNRFIIWGIMANPKEDLYWEKGSVKFVSLYNLNNLTIVNYTSQLIPFEVLPYGEENK